MKNLCLILTLGLCLVLQSCVSMDRMVRVSPFHEDEGISSTDRVSMFPLYYQNEDENSVLWPLIDWDDEGFAFRPIYVKEGSEHAFLWPLSGWDTEAQDGWFLTSSWDKNGTGLFPLFHKGKRFSYYGPFVSSKSASGLLPLYYHDEEMLWLAELFVKNEKKDSTQYRFLSFLGNYESWQNGDSRSWLIPLYYSSKEGNEEKFISPLYVHHQDGGKSYSHLLTAYWGDNGTGVFPLFHQGDSFSYYGPYMIKDDGHALFPLYYKDDETLWFAELYAQHKKHNSLERRYLSFLGNHKKWDNGNTRSWLFPFYYYKKTQNKEELISPFVSSSYRNGHLENMNVLGLLYNSFERKDYSHKFLLWPLFVQEKQKSGKVETDLAFLWHSESNDKTGQFKRSLWPLFSYGNKGAREDFWTATSLFSKGGEEQDNYITTWFWGREKSRGKKSTVEGNININSKSYYYHSTHSNYEEHTDGYYFLFGDYKEYKYADGIPRARDRYRQRLQYSYSNDFLFNSYEKKVFRRWKEGSLSAEEMKMIDAWQERLVLRSIKRPKSSISVNRNLIPRKDVPTVDEMTKLLTKHGITVKGSEDQHIDEALFRLAGKYSYLATTTEKSSSFNIFKSTSSEEDHEWKFLWGVLQSKKKDDRAQTSFLKYLYRREQEKEEVRRDIFPFVKWDSGKESRFSFLGFDKIGYLFNVKKDSEGWGGHFCFIPW